MSIQDSPHDPDDVELSCPITGCDYADPSAQSVAAHVGGGHSDGWDATDATPTDLHERATETDPEAAERVAKVLGYLHRCGVPLDALRVFYHSGYGSVQIRLEDRLGSDDWEAFREATDVQGIRFVGDGLSYCTEEFVEGLPPVPRSDRCEHQDCGREDTLAPVVMPCGGERTLCRTHRKHTLGVSS